MVCEVMGRSAGWIGLTAGIAGDADVILLPEHPFDIELVAERIRAAPPRASPVLDRRGREGAAPVAGDDGRPRLPPRPERLAAARAGSAAWSRPSSRGGRATRPGSPCSATCSAAARPVAYDRVLATRLGVAAVDEAVAGGWGRLVGVVGERLVTTPIAEVGRAARLGPRGAVGGSRRSSATEAARSTVGRCTRRRLPPMRSGILTGGGDVPGLNASHQGRRDAGGVGGPRGRRDPARVGRAPRDRTRRPGDDRERTSSHLDPGVVRTIDRSGGTFLHTSRTNPAKVKAADEPAFLRRGAHGRRPARPHGARDPGDRAPRASTR